MSIICQAYWIFKKDGCLPPEDTLSESKEVPLREPGCLFKL